MESRDALRPGGPFRVLVVVVIIMRRGDDGDHSVGDFDDQDGLTG